MAKGGSGEYYKQITVTGVADYIRAARILTDHGAATGPTQHCQGQAVEIALKLCWKGRGVPDDWKGQKGHDLVYLAGRLSDLTLTDEERGVLECLNTNYLRDGALRYPSRYRSSEARMFKSPSQQQVESLLESILAQKKPRAE